MKKPLVPVLACAALVATAFVSASPASASDDSGTPGVSAGTPTTLVSGLVGPLSLQVDGRRVLYLTQNFGGVLTKVSPSGTATEVTAAPGKEIAAVSYRRGTVYYAENAQDLSSGVLKSVDSSGTVAEIADIHAYEYTVNPDGSTSYGFIGLPQSCLDQIGPDAMAPGAYTGLTDSHPYASLANGSGVYVADAGANAIFRVRYSGAISTVAVLPPAEPVVVTAELAAEAGFPACVEGYKYAFESVPTDVEWGPDGWLYVTSLPGGPEDPSLGARGSVYKVHPWSGEVKLVAQGFVGATGLAVASDGSIFVAELFGGDGTGQVSVVDAGSDAPRKLIALSAPAAIDLKHNTLYVTTDSIPGEGAPPDGKVTLVPLTSE